MTEEKHERWDVSIQGCVVASFAQEYEARRWAELRFITGMPRTAALDLPEHIAVQRATALVPRKAIADELRQLAHRLHWYWEETHGETPKFYGDRAVDNREAAENWLLRRAEEIEHEDAENERDVRIDSQDRKP